jgi:anti-sigma B factor antagonist
LGGGPEFSLSCEQDAAGSQYVVTIAGDVDIASVPAIREFILALDGDVEVSCERVTFIDSAGLALFVMLSQAFRVRGQNVALRRLSGNCYKLFELTGLLDLVDVAAADT